MAIPIIGGIFKEVFGGVKDVVSEVIVDKDKRNQLEHDLDILELQMADKYEQRIHDEMMGQIGVNTEEAKSESVFVAGWRPAIGWIGAIGLGWSFVLQPIGSWAAEVMFKYTGDYPALNVESLMVLITGMLGFGTLRTYEKKAGVAMAPPEDGGQPTNILPANFSDKPEKAPWDR